MRGPGPSAFVVIGAVATLLSAAPAVAEPSVLVAWRSPEESIGVAVDASGRAYTVTTVAHHRRSHALVRAFRPDGSVRWERIWRPGGSSTVARDVTVADDGAVIVSGSVKFVDEPACDEIWGWGWAIRAWGPDGAVRWQRTQPGWRTCEVFGTHGRAVAASGDTVAMAVSYGHEYGSWGYVLAFGADGSRRWRRWIDPPGSENESVADVAVGRDGAVYVAASRNVGGLDEPEPDQDAIVVKVGSDGVVRWIRAAPDLGAAGEDDGDRGTSVAVDRGGVVFASVLGEPDGSRRARLAGYGTDGSLRWQRAVPWVSGYRWGDAFVRAGAEGAVLATVERNRDAGTHIVLRCYSSTGHERWRHRVGPTDDRSWGPTALDARGDWIVVSGRPARAYGWNRVWLLAA